MNSQQIAYVNGEFLPESEAKISINDRGFIYGDAVFDTARTFNGKIFFLNDHIDRLFESCKYLDINPVLSKEEYIKLMQEYEWNKLVYDAKYNFTPILGHTYYLYQHEEGYLWLSLVEPEQWDQIYVGAFKLTSNDKWEKVDE